MSEDQTIEKRKDKLLSVFKNKETPLLVKILAIATIVLFFVTFIRFLNLSFPVVTTLSVISWFLLALAFLIATALVYFKKDKFAFAPVLLWLVWINVYIRSLPMATNPTTGKPYLWDMTQNNWTLGPDLDPFVFLRYAKLIVEKGFLPNMDYMRYVPNGYPTHAETTLLSQSIAWLYDILKIFSSNVTVEYAGVLLPVVASVFAALGFFLLVRKIFEEKGRLQSNIMGLLGAAFMITLPSLLPRTIAGIPEKESLGFGLMFFAFYFFVAALRSEKTRNNIILGVLAGLFTGLMGQIWGGVLFIYIAIAITGLIIFILEKVDKKEITIYASWLIGSLIFWLPFTKRMTFTSFFTSSSTLPAVIVLILFAIYYILFKTKVKESKILHNKTVKKIPPVILVLIVFAIIALFVPILIGIIRLGIGIIPQSDALNSFDKNVLDKFDLEIFTNMYHEILSKLTNPYSERHALTVAENKEPYFDEWKSSFGPAVLDNIPLFFWLFFIGAIYLFYETLRPLKSKERWILTGSFTFFLIALVFSRSSTSSILNGDSTISKILYVFGYLALAASILYILYLKYKEGDHNKFKEIRPEYLFVFALIFVGIIAGRNAIRFIMVLAPIAVIPLVYLLVRICSESFNKKRDELVKMLLVLFAIIIILGSGYTLYYNYRVSEATSQSYVPSSYTVQWQEAMAWVRENTPTNAVFGHWWDYGYWVQSIGERATMLDGSNSINYWNYLMGRYVLTGENESSALEVLYNHNVTYFLIDSTDIGKYSAYASIGSDEKYDRLSWISTFLLDDSQTHETTNQTIQVYTGGTLFDEDLILNDSGKQVLLPKQKAGVGAILVPFETLKNKNSSYAQPSVVIVYQGKQYQENLRYLYIDNKLIDFKTGISGCAYIFQSLDVSGQQVSANNYGAAMYLSPRNMRALWVHLYLLREGKNFELVHTQANPIVASLRSQGMNLSDIIYYQGVQGPIKIWKVNYTGKETYQEEYMRTDFPESIKQRNFA